MTKGKKKVIFITKKLQNYRIPILMRVVQNAELELTVCHSGPALLDDEPAIDELIVPERTFWKFTVHEQDLHKICSKFDAAVVMMYLQRVSFMKLLFIPNKKYKLIYWGIGVKASVSTKFDTPSVFNYARFFIARVSDASIFYTDYARKKYLDFGIDGKKLFVMPNTVEVAKTELEDERKKSILFVGALYKQKKIFTLLDAYLAAYQKDPKLLPLVIVGGGEEYEPIKQWVIHHALTGKITLEGPVYDEEILKNYFLDAVATISPGQAGLSVLKSMGYGVPFVTVFDAATGGERLSIEHNVNGILYRDDSELPNLILEMGHNKEKFVEMGIAAKKFYDTFRTPEMMAQGFIDAVNFVTEEKN